jgi:hypothetical protein
MKGAMIVEQGPTISSTVKSTSAGQAEIKNL